MRLLLRIFVVSLVAVLFSTKVRAERLNKVVSKETGEQQVEWRCSPSDGVASAEEIPAPLRAIYFGCALSGAGRTLPLTASDTIKIERLPAAKMPYGWTGYRVVFTIAVPFAQKKTGD